jgi:hypothetical protein
MSIEKELISLLLPEEKLGQFSGFDDAKPVMHLFCFLSVAVHL